MKGEKTFKLSAMGHGGKAFGRIGQQTIFVAGALPGETVRVQLPLKQAKTIEAKLLEIVKRSPDRIDPRCQPADIEIASFQHVRYSVQRQLKQMVVRDQFTRRGKLKKVPLEPIVSHPTPWGYRMVTALSPTQDGRLGYWSPSARAVVRVEKCAVLTPALQALVTQIDLKLPDLLRLTVRMGSDGAGQLAFAMKEAEPPNIEIDFPVSVALVMPDGVAATLIGYPQSVLTIDDHAFSSGAGSYFPVCTTSAEMLSATVHDFAALQGHELVVDCFSGIGILTNRLAQHAAEVIGVEKNADSIEDLAENLDHTDNVALYNDWAEDALPALGVQPDLLVIDTDGATLGDELIGVIAKMKPQRLIYSSPKLESAAADARELQKAGFRLKRLRPIDTQPQTWMVHTVGLWEL